MELLVVIAIVGAITFAVSFSFSAITKADLRSAAFRTAGAMRYVFDRATMTGMYMRLAINVDKGEVWIEESEDMLSLRPGREQHTTDRNEETELEKRERAEHEARSADFKEMEKRVLEKKKALDDSRKASIPFVGLGTSLTDDSTSSESSTSDGDDGSAMQPGIDHEVLIYEWEKDMMPVERTRASFKPLKSIVSRKIKLARGIKILGVTTPRVVDPIDKGFAYVYFFPQGHSEAAIIHFTDKDEEKVFSVVMHPLTGQAKVYACYYEIPEDFGVSDDERKKGRDACAKEGAL